jgi:hypothetical protein
MKDVNIFTHVNTSLKKHAQSSEGSADGVVNGWLVGVSLQSQMVCLACVPASQTGSLLSRTDALEAELGEPLAPTLREQL